MLNRIMSFSSQHGQYFIIKLLNTILATIGLKWMQGRQMTHYYKMAIISSDRFKFDMYLLKFPTGSYINDHKDPVSEGFEHHRVNIILNKGFKGGKFVMNGKAQQGRIHRFRPDRYKHRVTEIKEGNRYVLSFGWLRRIDDGI